MSGVTSGQFLTDATEFHMDNDDLGFLYFICNTNSRPTAIRYTIYEPCSGVTVSDAIGYGGITKEVNYDGYSYQGLANDEIVLDDKAEPPIPSEARFCATTYLDTNITYASINHKMFYFPIGPYQVFNYLTITGHTNWAYYKVDILSGTTVFNNKTFVVWRKEKCNEVS